MKIVKRKYRFEHYTARTSLAEVEKYLNKLPYDEEVIGLSPTTKGWAVLIKGSELVDED